VLHEPCGAVRVSTVAVAERPGRISAAPRLFRSISMLTGTRWTILVKLPVAFFRRQQRELRTGAGRQAVDGAGDIQAGIHVERNPDPLTAADVAQLGLLVVGDQIDIMDRHDRQQAGAGLDILPDADRPVADRTGDRGVERRVRQAQSGLFEPGLARLSAAVALPRALSRTAICLRA